ARGGWGGTGGRARAPPRRGPARPRPRGASGGGGHAGPAPGGGRGGAGGKKPPGGGGGGGGGGKGGPRSCRGASERFDQPLFHDLRRPHEADSLLAPFLEQLLRNVLVDPLHRVRHDEQPRVRQTRQQTFDGRLVAHVGRDAVQHDIVGA